VQGPDGNVWFTIGFGPSSIGNITPSGTITTFPTPTLNSYPFGIAVGADGRIWFTEIGGGGTHRIGVIPTTATSGADVAEYPIDGTNPNPEFITAGPDGRMWFSELNKGVLGAITLGATGTTTSTTSSTTLPGGCDAGPTYASIDCRLDELIATLQAATDLGRSKGALVGAATKARTKKQQAEGFAGAGKTKQERNAARKAVRALKSFLHRLRSHTVKKNVPAATLQALTATTTPILDDLTSLASGIR
jgi:hypothetical protein